MKLISMTDFVLETYKNLIIDHTSESYARYVCRTLFYAQFLKRPLKLEMFVPCVDGEPIHFHEGNVLKIASVGSEVLKQAKEKVLFEGFTNCGDYIINSMGAMYLKREQFNAGFIIENKCIGLQLTESAIKQIS